MEDSPNGTDIVQAACSVLLTADPHAKAARTEVVVRAWREGRIALPLPGRSYAVPDRPARDGDKVKLVAPWAVPKRGRGGTLGSRQAMLHSLTHVECSAIDLAWDIIARFGAADAAGVGYQLPCQFYDDFVTVAADECRHFLLLEQRLRETGSHYGALAAHEGLWEAAAATAGSLAARLAVEHCVHEARGLDTLPQTIQRFRSNGDATSADLLQDVIYPEEITHCAAGVRWLKHLHGVAHGRGAQQQAPTQQLQRLGLGEAAQAGGSAAERPRPDEQRQRDGSQPAAGGPQHEGPRNAAAAAVPEWVADARQFASVEAWFHALTRRQFGHLKPPFNEEARAKAGLGPEWYLPLVAAAAEKGGGGDAATAAAAAAAEPAAAAAEPAADLCLGHAV